MRPIGSNGRLDRVAYGSITVPHLGSSRRIRILVTKKTGSPRGALERQIHLLLHIRKQNRIRETERASRGLVGGLLTCLLIYPLEFDSRRILPSWCRVRRV